MNFINGYINTMSQLDEDLKINVYGVDVEHDSFGD